MTLSIVGQGIPPCWRAYFFLLRQEKVPKKKATPGSAPLRGSLRYSVSRAACQNSPAAQTWQADCPRPACVARHLPRGPKSGARPSIPRIIDCCGRPEKKPKNEIHRLSADALPGPSGGAEQRRKAGGLRRGLSEGRSPEFRSRLACRVVQGTGAAGTDPGSPSFCLLFLGEARKSETPSKGGTPSQ